MKVTTKCMAGAAITTSVILRVAICLFGADGRLGWWWVVGGVWYFYPQPAYPYPDPYVPPVVVVDQAPQSDTPSVPPPAQNWYYCEASKSYYPYVANCPAGWKTVPATPSAK